MIYGNEDLVSITQGNINSLEVAQNKDLRIIIGAVKTTAQSCTNPPIAMEIKKQAYDTYRKIKA